MLRDSDSRGNRPTEREKTFGRDKAMITITVEIDTDYPKSNDWRVVLSPNGDRNDEDSMVLKSGMLQGFAGIHARAVARILRAGGAEVKIVAVVDSDR